MAYKEGCWTGDELPDPSFQQRRGEEGAGLLCQQSHKQLRYISNERIQYCRNHILQNSKSFFFS